MYILAAWQERWMKQVEAALLAEGVALRWDYLPPETPRPRRLAVRAVCLLDVADADAARAVQIVTQQYSESLLLEAPKAPAGRRGTRATPSLWLEPAFALGVGLAGLIVIFFALTGAAKGGCGWVERGGLVGSRVWMEGSWWRLVTAATLHADWEHALSNAGFVWVLAWAAAEHFGSGGALAVWLATAVAGFGTSLVAAPAVFTVGASGGLFGLLGAATAAAWRAARAGRGGQGAALLHWRRILGAGVLLVAMSGFGFRANIAAHLGGFGAGLLLGWLPLERWRQRAAVQALLVSAVAAALYVAWRLAWSWPCGD